MNKQQTAELVARDWTAKGNADGALAAHERANRFGDLLHEL